MLKYRHNVIRLQKWKFYAHMFLCLMKTSVYLIYVYGMPDSKEATYSSSGFLKNLVRVYEVRQTAYELRETKFGLPYTEHTSFDTNLNYIHVRYWP